MPNHVRNTLTIFGSARDVAHFVMLSQTPMPHTGDTPTNAEGFPNHNYHDEPLPARVPFGFHGVVPLPTAYSLLPYHGAGYELEHATWGVKWGAYNVDTDHIAIQEHSATFTFTTAWSTPDLYYQKASLRFPQCTLAVSYGGEGPCFGRAVYQSGACLEAEEGDVGTLPAYDEDDDGATYHAAVEQYLTTHHEWVADMIAQESPAS